MSKEDFGYGIVIKLNPEFVSHASSLNKTLASQLPGVTNLENIWHITLYHGVFEHKDLPKIWEEVCNIDFSNINRVPSGNLRKVVSALVNTTCGCIYVTVIQNYL